MSISALKLQDVFKQVKGALQSNGIVDVTLPVRLNGQIAILHLSKVLVVPDLSENLKSVSKLQADGLKVEFDNNAVVHRM